MRRIVGSPLTPRSFMVISSLHQARSRLSCYQLQIAKHTLPSCVNLRVANNFLNTSSRTSFPDASWNDRFKYGGADRKTSRSPSSKTSSRRVAAEAPHSITGSRGPSFQDKRRDREVETKKITAFCAAEQYDLSHVARIIDKAGYQIDPFSTNLYPQVIHTRIPSSKTEFVSHDDFDDFLGDLFVFPSGTIVTWNVQDDVALKLISHVLLPAAINPHTSKVETEDLEYYEDFESEKCKVTGDLIRLGMKADYSIGAEQSASTEEQHNRRTGDNRDGTGFLSKLHQSNITLAKTAFSSGLARSAKLGFLESTLDTYFVSTRNIPTLLSQGAKLSFTRSFILRKIGELLYVRAQLNLSSELTDSLPDLFWDSRHELGLESYFEQVANTLDTDIRIKTLNERLNYAQEIATVLRDRLSEKHGEILEWSIIILISIEVFFEMLRLYREAKLENDPDSTESLVRRFLKRDLGEDVT